MCLQWPRCQVLFLVTSAVQDGGSLKFVSMKIFTFLKRDCAKWLYLILAPTPHE